MNAAQEQRGGVTAARFSIPECPAPIAAVLSRLPAWPPSFVMCTALNAVLSDQLPDDVRERLTRRHLRIEIRDARTCLDFTWNGQRFTPLPRQSAPDLTISATGPDFLRLARREEDPDTLFFSRRLAMQGDTELGVLVKNTLDALELPIWRFPHVRRPWEN